VYLAPPGAMALRSIDFCVSENRKNDPKLWRAANGEKDEKAHCGWLRNPAPVGRLRGFMYPIQIPLFTVFHSYQ